MSPKSLLLAFAPLLLFTVISRFVSPAAAGWAALASAVVAVIVVLTGLRHGVKLITAASVVVFVVLAAIGLLGGSHGSSFVALFGAAVCALVIGGLMLVSVVTTPFTAQYARESVPEQYWTSPVFLRVNKRISATWAAAVLAIGASRLCYGLIADGRPGVPTALGVVLSWGIPILAVVLALWATKKITSDVDRPPVATGPDGDQSPLG